MAPGKPGHGVRRRGAFFWGKFNQGCRQRSPKQTPRNRNLDFQSDSSCTAGGQSFRAEPALYWGAWTPRHHSAAPKSKLRVNRRARPIDSLDLRPPTNFARREADARTYVQKSLDPPPSKCAKTKIVDDRENKICSRVGTKWEAARAFISDQPTS